MPEGNAGGPKISRREFLRASLLAAAGVAAAACGKKVVSSGGEKKEPGGPKEELAAIRKPEPPSHPPPLGSSLPAVKTIETDPQKELEKQLLEVIKPAVAEFFEKYGQDIPEAARVEFEEKGSLPPTQPWADNIGGWYKSLMEHTGSDSGVYEEMTMDEWGYLMLMIDQRADAPDPNDNEGLERFAAGFLYDFNLDHLDTNVNNLAVATKIVYQNWQELIPENSKEFENSRNIRALALLYSCVSLGTKKQLLRNSFQFDQAVAENSFTKTELLFFEYAQLTDIGRISTLPPIVRMLSPGGAEDLPRGAYFKPKRKTGAATDEPEIRPTREEVSSKDTEPEPTPKPKTEKPVEKKPKIISEIKEAYTSAKETKLPIQQHGYEHKDLHWQTVKGSIGIKKEGEFKEENRRIEPLAAVVHYTAGGTTEDCITYLSGTKRETVVPSVQFVIGKDGTVHQVFDQEDYLEFHDGGPNPVAFGIEIVADNADDVSTDQLVAVARLISYLKDKYGISYVSSHKNAHLLAKKLLEERPDLAKKNVRPVRQSKPDPGEENMEILCQLLENSGLKFIQADVPNLSGETIVNVQPN
ncbi:N-acetylmuramoyl-L-alanine amidase [Patescibacteria group bacterium]|nr:N-acetylmuramoyl-L-alanine amidase [Patescibacteria group bacterium]